MEAKILIAGGGTGGHVYPALAIIEALKEQGNLEFLYVGGKQGIETRIVPDLGIPMKTIWISGFMRGIALKNLLFPLKLLISMIQSWQIVRKFNPQAAVGTGGYVSGPILYVAARRSVPVLIQEQDVYPGITSRLLAKYARRICLSFEAAREHFQRFGDKLLVTGNPVRKNLQNIDRQSSLKYWGFAPDKDTLFIFGGSQGARAINQAMLAILPALLQRQVLQVLWQTGEKDYNRLKESARFDEQRVKLVPYINNMPQAYGAADVIISRAGASSLAELALVAKPSILVPYPYAAGNHQEYNSRMAETAGAALVVKQGQEWEKELQDTLEKLLQDRQLRERQAAAWQNMARPGAAETIGKEVLKLINLHAGINAVR